jgi:hypothetical protein
LNVRENREWTNQRPRQHREHKKQDENTIKQTHTKKNPKNPQIKKKKKQNQKQNKVKKRKTWEQRHMFWYRLKPFSKINLLFDIEKYKSMLSLGHFIDF